jgi:hypothetical protein
MCTNQTIKERLEAYFQGFGERKMKKYAALLNPAQQQEPLPRVKKHVVDYLLQLREEDPEKFEIKYGFMRFSTQIRKSDFECRCGFHPYKHHHRSKIIPKRLQRPPEKSECVLKCECCWLAISVSQTVAEAYMLAKTRRSVNVFTDPDLQPPIINAGPLN